MERLKEYGCARIDGTWGVGLPALLERCLWDPGKERVLRTMSEHREHVLRAMEIPVELREKISIFNANARDEKQITSANSKHE